MAGEVVGRGATGGVTTTTTSTTSGGSEFIKNINDRLNATNLGAVVNRVNVTVDEAIASLTLAQKKQIGALLDKAGFTVRTPAEFDAVLATYFPNLVYRDFPDLLRQVKDNLISSGKEEKPDLARNIVKYDEDVLKEVAQAVALKKQGARLTDAELQDAIDLANSMIQKGTVTESKKVRNPKTGKLETVTTTTPGFSQERFGLELGKQIEEQSPQLVERRQAFEFMDEMSKVLSGGM